MIKNNFSAVTLLGFFGLILPGFVSALPANQNQLEIKTGTTKREGETAFSTLVSWRKGDANTHRANGLIFINGVKTHKVTTDTEVARKLVNALNASINYDSPSERGAIASYNKNKAELLISNKAGFDLAQITTRDYSNQALQYSIPGKSFASASVELALDFVYSAAVEYVEGFSAVGKKKTAGGLVTVTIDDNAPIKIKTGGKTTEQIENELARVLGARAHFSNIPIYPNYVELRSRNYKEFDGGEVQLSRFNAKSIRIDVDDSGLGILTKFKYPDVNKPTDVANNMPMILAIILAGVFGFIFYISKIKPGKQETSA